MWMVWATAALVLIALTLVDAFETIIQPRRVTHRFRFARLYYRTSWSIWRSLAPRFSSNRGREAFLSVFGPMSMLGLLFTWLTLLIIAFGVLHWSLQTTITAPERAHDFATYLYLSGTTIFTLGFGDVTPMRGLGRSLAVIESGLGFGFLALIISYVPVLYQAYSVRETTIGLLDARAGSPPTAGQFLLRIARGGNIHAVDSILAEWERWSAELLEIQLSFPVLTYYRSQHDNQSWLAALAMILDTCALLLVEVKRSNSYQSQLTFAMARHAAVDLSLVLKARPYLSEDGRFSRSQRESLRTALAAAGVTLNENADSEARLSELRGMYEPFLFALADRFLFALPPIHTDEKSADNWQRSAWMQRAPGIGSLPIASTDAEHFD
ncbi:hypothetical protein BH09PLA1_BH09PLA1_10120 [soil metagenome]